MPTRVEPPHGSRNDAARAQQSTARGRTTSSPRTPLTTSQRHNASSPAVPPPSPLPPPPPPPPTPLGHINVPEILKIILPFLAAFATTYYDFHEKTHVRDHQAEKEKKDSEYAILKWFGSQAVDMLTSVGPWVAGLGYFARA
ncbi:hypothetical protein WAI453_010410 [Rhynchosporium graminicola]|uniref:Uncharacterized protein n=1 Tax=Rhynchosporium graminicola TaxID=2792576 RepID=A0A1E1JTC0_9HELO|nr:uncharacterized protein RCO7_04672 [Rhynchosporium commune]